VTHRTRHAKIIGGGGLISVKTGHILIHWGPPNPFFAGPCPCNTQELEYFQFWTRNWSHVATYFDLLLVLLLFVGAMRFKNSVSLRRFKPDRNEICQNVLKVNTHRSTDGDGVEFSNWRHTFKMAAMSAQAASARRIRSSVRHLPAIASVYSSWSIVHSRCYSSVISIMKNKMNCNFWKIAHHPSALSGMARSGRKREHLLLPGKYINEEVCYTLSEQAVVQTSDNLS